MAREEIQTANPGGVRDRPAADKLRSNLDGAPPIPGLRVPPPDRNVPACLSFACGLFALLLAVGGFLTAGDSPRWLAGVLAYSPAGTETATLLAVAAFLLAIFGVVGAVCYSSARGLPWAVAGLTTSGLAICTVLLTWGELATKWQ